MMKTKQPDKHTFGRSFIGCVLDRSAYSADDLNEATIEFARSYGFGGDTPNENDEDYSEILSEVADAAVAYLNDGCEGLQYCYWFFEDNSLFYLPDVDTARESVDFVSSREQEYPPQGYQGEWLHVSDHGNPTLYLRYGRDMDTEIWGVL